jgi:hypothetical protein
MFKFGRYNRNSSVFFGIHSISFCIDKTYIVRLLCLWVCSELFFFIVLRFIVSFFSYLLLSFFVLGFRLWILNYIRSMRRMLLMTRYYFTLRLAVSRSFIDLLLFGRCSVGGNNLTFPSTNIGCKIRWNVKQMIYKRDVRASFVTSTNH